MKDSSICDNGYVSINMIETNVSYRSPLYQYETILRDWKAGAAFIETTSMFNAPQTIKGTRIESVIKTTKESLRLIREENEYLETQERFK